MTRTFKSSALSLLLLTMVVSIQGQSSTCPSSWQCYPTSTAPTLDGELADWPSTVVAVETSLQGALTGAEYEHGPGTFQCQYDSTHIYLALQFPGLYRFNATDYHQCAAIATMQKIGVDATFYNMGGCSAATDGANCSDPELLAACEPHRVDIGVHWELSETEQGTVYPVKQSDSAMSTQAVSDGDSFLGLDDEWSVSPFCRADDNGANSGNEWSGAWTHDNPTDGELGTYVFELSRSLTTASTSTDGQLTAGETHSFGVAFWDPFTTEEGWDDADHFVSGCLKWMDLELVTSATDAGGSSTGSDSTGSNMGGSSTGNVSSMFSAATPIFLAQVSLITMATAMVLPNLVF